MRPQMAGDVHYAACAEGSARLRDAIQRYYARHHGMAEGEDGAEIAACNRAAKAVRTIEEQAAVDGRSYESCGARAGEILLTEVRAFLARTGMAPSRLGRNSVGDPQMVNALEAGHKPRRGRFIAVRGYMAHYRPKAPRK